MSSILFAFSNRIFGKSAHEYRDKYRGLHGSIRQARIPLTLDQYLSRVLFFSILAGLIAEIIGYRIILEMINIFGAPALDMGGNDVALWIENNMAMILAVIFSLFLFLLVAEMVFNVLILYPGIKASVRKSQIDHSLPHAITYLYAMSRSGMNLLDLFKSLGSYSYIYGTTADEVKYIVRDMEYFGYDLLTALRIASSRSPSEKFKDFIDGLISIIKSGGNVVSYLKSKSEQYYLIASQEQKSFLRTLGMLAEVYITAFVAGPLFLITILLVLGVIGGDALNILYVLVYAFIPIATLLFLILLSTLQNISEEIPEIHIREKKLAVFNDVPIEPSDGDEADKIRHLVFYRKLSRFTNAVLHPFKTLSRKPNNGFYLSIPAGLIYVLLTVNLNTIEGFRWYSLHATNLARYDDTIVFSLMIMFIPFAFFYELRLRKIKRFEKQMPEFLKKLASVNEAGISLTKAIGIAAESNIGVLKTEIKRVSNDIEWGTPTNIALKKMEKRIRTGTIARIITLLTKASESTGDIKSVLVIAASTADVTKRLKEDRYSNMFIYVFIIYITFFVFLFIVYILSAFFLPSIPAGTGEMGGDMPLSIGINVDEYILVFFHASLIQGFCSGLVAGQMGEGIVFSGLKHSLIMMAIAYLVFILLI